MFNRWLGAFMAILTIVVLVSIVSCQKTDNQAQTKIDTLHIGYESCIKPILDSKCVQCHATGNTSGYVNLDSYEHAKPFGINGNLYGSVQHLDGNVAMPPGGTKLDSSSLFLIKKWVQEGCLP